MTAEPSEPAPVVETNVKQGALIGGVVCLVVGLLFQLISSLLFFIYGPLYLASFILSIVAMSQKRVGAGLAVLLGTILLPPIVWTVSMAMWSANVQECKTACIELGKTEQECASECLWE